MSCTVIALPYAIFMIVSSVAASIVAEASEKNNNSIGELYTTFNQEISCEDIERITEEHYIEILKKLVNCKIVDTQLSQEYYETESEVSTSDNAEIKLD